MGGRISGRGRLLLVAVALALLAPAAGSGAPRWLPAEQVSPPGTAATSPRVAVDGSGNAIAAWSADVGGATQIAVADRAAGSNAWSAPVAISAPAVVEMGQVALAADGAAVAVWTISPVSPETARAVVEVAVRPPGSATFGPPQDLTPSAVYGVSPRLAVDGRGTVLLTWEERSFGPTNPGTVMAAVRQPGSAVFDPPEALSQILRATPPDVAVNAAGDAVVVWAAGPRGEPQTMFARSRPAGASVWGPTTAISAPGVNTAGARVAIDSSGAAVAAWIAGGDSGRTLQAASRLPDGAWSPPEDLAPVATSEAPSLVMEPDGTTTVVFLRPGTGTTLAARVRPAGGGWSAGQDLSQPGTPIDAGPTPVTGDRAAVGPQGGVLVVWTSGPQPSAGMVQVASKPAGAASFEPAVTLSAPDQDARAPQAALGPGGEAVAVWVSPTVPLTPFGGIASALLTGRPEPLPVHATGIGAPARATAGALVRLTASFASPVGSVTLRPQRLGAAGFVDEGPPSVVQGSRASVQVRVRPGRNVLRIAYLDRGASAYTEAVTVTGTPPGRPLIPAGPRPVALAVGLGSVWVLSVDDKGEGSVLRIDPRTRRIIGSPIPVGRASSLTVGVGAVWVAGARGEVPGLQRIDPVSMTVSARFPLATTGSVGAGAGGVWAIECGGGGALSPSATDCGEQRLMMVGPGTNTATPVIGVVPAGAQGAPLATGLAVGARTVWFTTAGDGVAAVLAYDTTGRRLDRSLAGSGLHGPLAASGSILWAGSGACGLSRVIEGRRPVPVLRRLPDSDRFSCGAGIVAGPRDVWIGQRAKPSPGTRSSPALPTRIVRIDARAGRVVGVPIGLGRGPIAFTVGEGAVWVAYPDAGVVARVDPGPAARARPRGGRP